MSEQLREFLTAWLAWAENGAPAHHHFKRHLGLCLAADKYSVVFDDPEIELSRELSEIFQAQGLDYSYPFGNIEFLAAVWADTQHLDPNRLAWVREQLK